MVPHTSVKGAVPVRRASWYGFGAGGAGRLAVKDEVGGKTVGEGAGGAGRATVDAVAGAALAAARAGDAAAGATGVRDDQAGHASGLGNAPGDLSDVSSLFPETSAAASGHEDNRTARQRTTGNARNRNVTAMLHLHAGEHQGNSPNRADFRATGPDCQAFLRSISRAIRSTLPARPFSPVCPPHYARCILRPYCS